MTILSDAQIGFRKDRSTVDAIFILNAVITKIINGMASSFCFHRFENGV